MRQHEADAFGTALMDFYQGKSKVYHIERDDNYLDAGDLSVYFTTYSDWSELEKFAMEEVSGRVLDIGCGAGRHSIYLQEKGFDVLGIDVSPLASETWIKKNHASRYFRNQTVARRFN